MKCLIFAMQGFKGDHVQRCVILDIDLICPEIEGQKVEAGRKGL